MLWREEQGCGREGGEGGREGKGEGQSALAVQQGETATENISMALVF